MSVLRPLVTVPMVLAFALGGCGRSPVELAPFILDQLEMEEDPVAEGCQKVDYLFVIDNSASMGDNQRRLIESFDTFVEGVERTQQSLESVHLGVVTTDQYVGHDRAECKALGGMVTRTDGHNSSKAACGPYTDGHNYMTEADDLGPSFSCAAQVGTTGSSQEWPLAALTAAISDEMTAVNGCNEGFLRDDALLVVVIVTDEDDPGPVDHRYEALVEAKGGRADNVVVVGLLNEPGTECSLSGHAREAPELFTFVNSFQHSFVAPVCGDYSEAFTRAVSVVQSACWAAGP
ncbi:MAG: hypothetical protein K0V04_45200 [Deltaproteobacteria bacterium]|nr:hypothetical protein [Deltaproteobacteria bacterium]